ncbi:MAG: STAS domain-containing protein [Desulfomonilia bacterium]
MNTDSMYGTHFSVQMEDGRISLAGIIDAGSSRDILDAYQKTSGTGAVRFDLRGIEHIDIAGINSLIKVYLHAIRVNRRVVFEGVSRHHREVFQATRIEDTIEIHAGDDTEGSQQPGSFRRSAWARPVHALRVTEVPHGALNLNIDGFAVAGPLQGFGQLWEKTYWVRLTGVEARPKEVIRVLKENFPRFQPSQNRFFPTRAGIIPGEIVIINARTPGGLISTGVWVVYADDESFTFMTPQGHPESGWVTFSAFEEQSVTTVKVVGFARASDPLYELGFRIAGSRLQEKIWTHVLASLADHFGVPAWVQMHKACVGNDLRWEHAGNVWYNAQIRTMVHTLRKHAL